MAKSTLALSVLIAAAITACGSPTATAPGSASAGATPALASGSPSPSPSPIGSPSAGPSGSSALAFPTTFGVTLAPGRYSSSPPFDIAFTFEIRDQAWRSGHIGADFFDIQQFDSGTTTGLPSRWIAFAHPAWIRSDAETPSEGLTAEAVTAAWAARSDLTVSDPAPFSLGGRDGLRVDIHADRANTTLFGGAGGAFGLGPEQDVRLGIVPHDGELLLVLVLASKAELANAWRVAEPILASVDFGG
jgi:hypothetical protein